MQVEGLSAADLILLALGALLVGFAKTSIGGVGSISVALFAAVLPARESTGALLPLLIAGDLFALQAYRAHADWPRLLRLFPAPVLGVMLFLAGIQLALGSCDFSRNKGERFVTLGTAALSVFNVGVAFVFGIVILWIVRRGWLKL